MYVLSQFADPPRVTLHTLTEGSVKGLGTNCVNMQPFRRLCVVGTNLTPGYLCLLKLCLVNYVSTCAGLN